MNTWTDLSLLLGSRGGGRIAPGGTSVTSVLLYRGKFHGHKASPLSGAQFAFCVVSLENISFSFQRTEASVALSQAQTCQQHVSL